MLSKNLLGKLTTIFQGFVMGIAEIIPGVSGSTLALTMGIYDDLINFLNQVSDVIKVCLKFIVRKASFSDIKKTLLMIDFKFGILLSFGGVVAVILLSNVLEDLVESNKQYVYAFFFGLIISSLYIPFKEIKVKNFKTFSIFIVTFILSFLILGIQPAQDVVQPSALFMFVAALIAVCGMVLPGVSGSFILLLLGLYQYILSCIKALTRLSIQSNDLLNIVIFAIGLVLGFSVFVKFLKIAFTKASDYVLSFLLGLMLSSTRVLWPFIEKVNGEYLPKNPWEMQLNELTIIVIIIAISIFAVFLISRMNVKEIENI